MEGQGDCHNIFCATFQTVKLLFLLSLQEGFISDFFFWNNWQCKFCLSLWNKMEKEGKTITFGHPDYPNVQRNIIIHVQFSHQEVSVVYGMYFRPISSWILWIMDYPAHILGTLPHEENSFIIRHPCFWNTIWLHSGYIRLPRNIHS